jgi:hypothetical protein
MDYAFENMKWRTAKEIEALNKKTERLARSEERALLQRYPYLRGGDKDKAAQR